jgi:hypothetical protein
MLCFSSPNGWTEYLSHSWPNPTWTPIELCSLGTRKMNCLGTGVLRAAKFEHLCCSDFQPHPLYSTWSMRRCHHRPDGLLASQVPSQGKSYYLHEEHQLTCNAVPPDLNPSRKSVQVGAGAGRRQAERSPARSAQTCEQYFWPGTHFWRLLPQPIWQYV